MNKFLLCNMNRFICNVECKVNNVDFIVKYNNVIIL